MNLASNDPRWVQFNDAFRGTLAESVDLEEFTMDDLYAFRVLERALVSHSASLRNLAEHLLVLRADVTDSINIKPVDHLNETSRMVSLKKVEIAPAAGQEQERRVAEGRFSPQQTKVLEQYKELYTKEFGDHFDIDEFATNDLYGRAVLLRTLTAQNQTLVKIARFFIDENGNPGRHRRNTRPSETRE